MKPLQSGDPERVGPYRLVGRLGAGGMGQVFLAHSPGGRPVVVKVIRPEYAADREYRARFAREVEAARRVGGFHTAQVIAADPDADPPWMATAYVPGPSLQQAVQQRGELSEHALRPLAAGLIEGLEAIHSCGLVHRDFKPGNIILAADGPRIIDFGIARPTDASTMTTGGAVMGTLAYMSPEQVGGGPVGPPSDVFSLGSVLAFAATGQSPFGVDSIGEVVMRIVSKPPELPQLPDDLRRLIHSCWQQDPEQRPTTADLLAQLRTVQFGNTWPPSELADLVGSALRASAVSPERQFFATPPQSYALPVPPPRPSTPSSGPKDASPVVEQAAPPASDDSPRGRRARHPRRRRPALARNWLVGGAVAAVVVGLVATLTVWLWKPNRPLSAMSSSQTTQGPFDVLVLETESEVHKVVFSPDGSLLASAESEGMVRLWDVQTGKELAELQEAPSGSWDVAFSPDGSLVVGSGRNSRIWAWNVETGQHLATLEGHTHGAVNTVAFSPDGSLLASGGMDSTVRLWDMQTGEQRTVFEGQHDGTVDLVVFSPDGSVLASGGTGEAVRLWDVENAQLLAELRGYEESVVESLAFSPDGSVLASASDDGTVRLWDVETGEELAELEGHTDWVRSVVFSPDGSVLATASDDHTVRLWDAGTGKELAELEGHAGWVNTVMFSPDGSVLASASDDGTVRLWEVETGKELAKLEGHTDVVWSAVFSPDGSVLASPSDDYTIRLWSVGAK
ncbi:WD40 repeat domain-containing serine/threonine protein kinase [Thermobifida cellulosilytica]|uniref:Protein kinase domain-containing protein n=1 Tax=Thermobifida cellulosilytica TB100 TaxID=665004 RepID=A0A147KGT1_THECS|nr:protein kinase [Thermobifida cellulosilytica]KUP96492.1 hypothetical protein AC529_12115 [Thermobifida cellulosilytica TB100]